MNRRRLMGMGMVLALSAALCGCQLARADAQVDEANLRGDRLIGALITTESIQTPFDDDAFLRSLEGRLSSVRGGEIFDMPVMIPSSQRTYATLEEVEVPDVVTGEPYRMEQYVFEDIEGIAFYAAAYARKQGDTWALTTSEAVDTAQYAVGPGNTIEGTVFLRADEADCTVYANPIYQTVDKRVYVVPAAGMIGTLWGEESGGMSTTLKNTYTRIVDGETTEATDRVIVHIAFKREADSVRIVQMSADNAVVDEATYAMGALPERIEPIAGAAYVIVERTAPDGTMLRDLIESTEEHAVTHDYLPRRDGFYTIRSVPIEWPASVPGGAGRM